MVSNGWLIDSNCANEIKQSGMDLVQISVDGFNKETHDWLRNKPGAHNRALAAIDNLIDADVMVGVSCTPTKQSIIEIDSLISLLNDKGVYIFRMQPMMYLGRGEDILDYFPTKVDYVRLSRKLTSIQNKNLKMKIEWGDPTEHLQAMSSGQNMRSMSINSYGDLMLTPYFPISFGNITRHRLSQYVNSGICNLFKHPVFSELCGRVDDEFSLNISKSTNLPDLYKSEFFQIDCIDDNIEDRMTRLKEIM